MEEAIPRQNAFKTAAENQCAHIRDDPVLVRETGLAHADQRGRRIYAAHTTALLDEILGDGLGRAAPDVENRSAISQKGQESVDPRFFAKVASAYTVPVVGVLLIEGDDSIPLQTSRQNANTVPEGQQQSHRKAWKIWFAPVVATPI